jgi:hypothetical protein
LIGRVPKVKLGDNEIDPTTAYRAGIADGADTAAAAAEATRERGGDVEEVVSAAKSVSDVISEDIEPRAGLYPIARIAVRDREVERIVDRTLDRAQQSHQYELQVASRIEQILQKVDPGRTISVTDKTTTYGPRGVADFELAADTKTGYIEALWTMQPHLDHRRVRDFRARLANPRLVRQEDPPALVISNAPPRQMTQATLEKESPNLRIVTWRDESDDAELQAAFSSFVELLR